MTTTLIEDLFRVKALELLTMPLDEAHALLKALPARTAEGHIYWLLKFHERTDTLVMAMTHHRVTEK